MYPPEINCFVYWITSRSVSVRPGPNRMQSSQLIWSPQAGTDHYRSVTADYSRLWNGRAFLKCVTVPELNELAGDQWVRQTNPSAFYLDIEPSPMPDVLGKRILTSLNNFSVKTAPIFQTSMPPSCHPRTL
jgi:hypothetical protein